MLSRVLLLAFGLVIADTALASPCKPKHSSELFYGEKKRGKRGQILPGIQFLAGLGMLTRSIFTQPRLRQPLLHSLLHHNQLRHLTPHLFPALL